MFFVLTHRGCEALSFDYSIIYLFFFYLSHLALYSGVLSLHLCIEAYRMLKLFRALFDLCGLNISHRATVAEEAGNHPAPRRALFTVLSHNKYRTTAGLECSHTVRGTEWHSPDE